MTILVLPADNKVIRRHTRIIHPWQAAAIANPFTHFAMFAGIAAGKSFTGSHFAIYHMAHYPELTGFVGANTFDQLSQASLRELMYWLDEYQIQYVIDCKPPKEWGWRRKSFKKYSNILSVFMPPHIVTVFIRTLSDPNALRGIEFSWYWLDETRDTKQDTHDVLVGRMRESDYMKGLITTTTNGEDWAYERFVRGNNGDGIYGSMHVSTRRSLAAGIIKQPYFDGLLRTFSPLMAEQEIEAKHVNVAGGRAYYAAGEFNEAFIAPWGDAIPDISRPLVVGCDFNFQPAPCIWMVGQVGPDDWGDQIHWFGEVVDVEVSSTTMANKLLGQFPGFFYQVFGDASGTRGTTSNAGETDYNMMAAAFDTAGAPYSIDTDQANPLVKDRVENFNAKLRNALGETTMTYDPARCPNLSADMKVVGWGPTGKLTSGGNINRTHASDGAGYAVWKLFPPGRGFLRGISSIATTMRPHS